MGARWNRLAEAILTSTYGLCFGGKYEKYQRFLSENFQFLDVKFSTHLHRCVFVISYTMMWSSTYYLEATVHQIVADLCPVESFCKPFAAYCLKVIVFKFYFNIGIFFANN